MNTPIGTFHVSRPAVYGEQNLKVVLHTDHLAAMAAASAYDEAAERKAAFEACPASGCDWGSFWQGWKLCAKARAKAAGCL